MCSVFSKVCICMITLYIKLVSKCLIIIPICFQNHYIAWYVWDVCIDISICLFTTSTCFWVKEYNNVFSFVLCICKCLFAIWYVVRRCKSDWWTTCLCNSRCSFRRCCRNWFLCTTSYKCECANYTKSINDKFFHTM